MQADHNPTANDKRPRSAEPVQLADTFTERVEEPPIPVKPEPEGDNGEQAVEKDNNLNENNDQQTIKIVHEVRHEVALPPGFDQTGYVSIHDHVPWPEPARSYPFTLDPFQRLAINCLERNESVLVSAHTSAGKTVVAEYAIAMSLKAKQRVIYTSPIKALSNQKYRELQERFTDVGLMTGDVTLNPDASCLVMTTEILRSMLYRGSEVMREVAWVVFDEIHYMRDKERGVVWEETIILLPHSVRYVFLSATIPNARQFARWIGHLHGQPCHVVYTNYRPTPLQHYLFPSGSDGIYLVVDEKGVFREDNFRKALNIFAESADGQPPADVLGDLKKNDKKRRKPGSQEAARDLYKIVKMITTQSYHPVIVFSFSKRDCETYAKQMSKLDFNTDDEKRLVEEIFKNAIESLNEEDRQIPPIQNILPLLKRGVGIHHSGLLPILKEVIEIMFQEGLIKVLFATETFSIGLNMPAKTVVFTSVRKFDGQTFRWISSGEYIQMSGRAGRRGLDDRGIVIMMIEEQMDPPVCTAMIKGQADALNSAFHLTYNMILNLMRVEGHSPEFMLEKSFFQFQSGDSIPELEQKLLSLTDDLSSMEIQSEAEISKYVQIRDSLERLKADYRKIVNHPSYCLPFLQSGRLVHVKHKTDDYGWGAVVNVRKVGMNAPHGPRRNDSNQKEKVVVDVLVMCDPVTSVYSTIPKPVNPNTPSHYEMVILPCQLDCLHAFSTIRTNLPADLAKADHKALVGKALGMVKTKFPTGLPLLDPIKDMKVTEKSFHDLIRKIDTVERSLYAHPIYSRPDKEELLAKFMQKEEKRALIKSCKREITTANSIVQMEELKSRKRILRRLGYCSDEDVITLKGRVACEVSSGDELLLCELIFSGGFTDLSIEQTVALLSCFVFEEKSDKPPTLRDELAGPFQLLKEVARKIVKASNESGLDLPEDQYLDSFRPEMMEVVWQWVRGARFAKICTMTDIFEGSIIRCMRRLEELMRQLSVASKAIGNDQLETKFVSGIGLLKRDIVFANSLYL